MSGNEPDRVWPPQSSVISFEAMIMGPVWSSESVVSDVRIMGSVGSAAAGITTGPLARSTVRTRSRLRRLNFA